MRKRNRPGRLDDREKSRLSEDLSVTSWDVPGSYSLLTDETADTGLLAGADLDDDADWEGPDRDEVGIGVADSWSRENTTEWLDTEVGPPSDREYALGSTDITGKVPGVGPGLGTSVPLDTTEEGFEPEMEGAIYEEDDEMAATVRERDEVSE
jgi:hypothetical protein